MEGSRVHVAIENERLREALVRRLRVRTGLGVVDQRDVEPGAAVIVVDGETTPDECLDLSARGVRVIVLLAVVREPVARRYATAGAVCVPMDIDTSLLEAAIRGDVPQALDGGRISG